MPPPVPPAARSGSVFDIAAAILHDCVREIRKPSIEVFDLCCGRAFLRGEYMGGAFGASQRIGDIAGKDNRNVLHGIGDFRIVNLRQISESAAAKRNSVVCRIEKTKPKRACQSGTAIRGGATAQSKHDAIRAGINRRTNQQASAECGSGQRIAVGGGDPLKSAC